MNTDKTHRSKYFCEFDPLSMLPSKFGGEYTLYGRKVLAGMIFYSDIAKRGLRFDGRSWEGIDNTTKTVLSQFDRLYQEG